VSSRMPLLGRWVKVIGHRRGLIRVHARRRCLWMMLPRVHNGRPSGWTSSWAARTAGPWRWKSLRVLGSCLLSVAVLLCIWSQAGRHAIHPKDFNVERVPAFLCVRNFVALLPVHLIKVDFHAVQGVQLLVADITLEVSGLLMLNENGLILEHTVTVVAKRFCSWCFFGLLLADHTGG